MESAAKTEPDDEASKENVSPKEPDGDKTPSSSTVELEKQLAGLEINGDLNERRSSSSERNLK